MRSKEEHYEHGGCIKSQQLDRQTAEYLRQYFKHRGYMPSFREISEKFDISKSTVHRIIGILEEKKYISVGRDKNGKMKERAIVIRGTKIKIPEVNL